MSSPEYREQIHQHGFVVVPDALERGLLTELRAALDAAAGRSSPRRRGIFAIRNLLDAFPEVTMALGSAALSEVVESILGSDAFLVGGLYFEERPGARWKLPWHQNATIAVRERAESNGFGPWTMKEGVLHVKAPPNVLAAMLSVRLYLDDCTDENGALRIIPQSHYFGRLPIEVLAEFTHSEPEVCRAPEGGLLALRPLLLHSARSTGIEARRRVIHLDFAASPLPPPLEWRHVHHVVRRPVPE